MIAVRAKVINTVAYEDINGTTAAYFEVLEEYRSDINTGNLIKLYGNSDGADCSPNVCSRFEVDTEVILLVGISTTYNGEVNDLGFHYENPGLDIGYYWEFGINTCHSLVLDIEDDVVKGRIDEDIFEYPWEFFNDELEECGFSLQKLDEFRCAVEDYNIFPNPSSTGKVRIRNSYNKPPINLVRIFDANGNFREEHSFESFPEYIATKYIQINEQGLYFLQIHCDEQVSIEQILVL